MVDISKQAVLEASSQRHQKVINQYHVHFDPLFLPKLAVSGYQLRPDPSCHIFFSQLLLIDRMQIKRENQFIDRVKKALLTGSNAKQSSLFHLLCHVTKKMRNNTFFLKNRHKYCQLLRTRLKDLNQCIFHLQRIQKEPILERQCRQLLQRQITSLSSDQGSNSNQKNNLRSSADAQGRNYFSLKAFKYNHRQNMKENMHYLMSQKKKKAKENEKNRRLVTEPNRDVGVVGALLLARSSSSGTTSNDPKQTAKDMFMLPNSSSSQLGLKKKEDVQNMRHSMAILQESHTNGYAKMSHQSRNSKLIGQGRRGFSKFIQKGSIPPMRPLSKKSTQYKSVKYYFEEQDANINLTADHPQKINHHRSSRFKPQSRARVSSHCSSLKGRATIQSKTPSKMVKVEESNLEQKLSSENGLQNSFASIEEAQLLIRKSQNFDCQSQHIQKQRRSVRAGKFRTDFRRFSAFVNADQQQVIETVVNRVQSRKATKQKIKVIRREATLKEDYSQQMVKFKASRGKRKGKRLGTQINKNLERLLIETNLEDMICDNQLRQGTRGNAKKNTQYFLDDRFIRKGAITQKDLNNLISRHAMTQRNNIMMEVDLEAEQKQYNQLKIRFMMQYVQNKGLSVTGSELLNLRRSFIDPVPYNQSTISHLYGGDNTQKQDSYEMIKDENGHYSFNRDFFQAVSKSTNKDKQFWRQQARVPQNQGIIDFGKSLVRQCQDLEQKSFAQ